MNKTLQTARYIFFDLFTAAASWTLFYIFRKLIIEPGKFGYSIPIEFSTRFYISLVIIPLFWLVLYFSLGFYRDVFRRSRLKEFGLSILVSLIGVIVIFFTLILDDTIANYRNYYTSFLVLFSIQMTLSYIPRVIITSMTIRKLQRGKWGFNTLIIGGNGKACDIYKELVSQRISAGNRFIGFANVIRKEQYPMEMSLPHLGSLDDVRDLVEKHAIEEVIIAIESEEHKQLEIIINKLEGLDIVVHIIPNLYDILTGRVRMSSLFGTPLIQVSRELMPLWQVTLKRIIDIIFSMLALLISLPVALTLVIAIRISSRGPAIYSHERIGRYGKPFRILKFRSMLPDAEIDGPQLSSRNDKRITRVGRLMRRTRLDEIPNFINVIKGDMSIVGPRPERSYFIDQITKRAPHYVHLHKVKPGITSWGQVKFGYAENVDQMIKRLRYDLIYIENMSLYVDIKIMIYTILTILRGKGV